MLFLRAQDAFGKAVIFSVLFFNINAFQLFHSSSSRNLGFISFSPSAIGHEPSNRVNLTVRSARDDKRKKNEHKYNINQNNLPILQRFRKNPLRRVKSLTAGLAYTAFSWGNRAKTDTAHAVPSVVESPTTRTASPRISGINEKKVKTFAFALLGTIAGVGLGRKLMFTNDDETEGSDDDNDNEAKFNKIMGSVNDGRPEAENVRIESKETLQLESTEKENLKFFKDSLSSMKAKEDPISPAPSSYLDVLSPTDKKLVSLKRVPKKENLPKSYLDTISEAGKVKTKHQSTSYLGSIIQVKKRKSIGTKKAGNSFEKMLLEAEKNAEYKKRLAAKKEAEKIAAQKLAETKRAEAKKREAQKKAKEEAERIAVQQAAKRAEEERVEAEKRAKIEVERIAAQKAAEKAELERAASILAAEEEAMAAQNPTAEEEESVDFEELEEEESVDFEELEEEPSSTMKIVDYNALPEKERAYQILLDLDMITHYPDPDSPDYDDSHDDELAPDQKIVFWDGDKETLAQLEAMPEESARSKLLRKLFHTYRS